MFETASRVCALINTRLVYLRCCCCCLVIKRDNLSWPVFFFSPHSNILSKLSKLVADQGLITQKNTFKRVKWSALVSSSLMPNVERGRGRKRTRAQREQWVVREKKTEILSEMLLSLSPPFIWSYMWVSGIERLQVVETAIGRLCVSGIDRQQSSEAATGYVV